MFRKLSENYQKIIRKLSENYQKIIRKLSENYQKIIRKLSENYQKNQALRYHPGRFSDKHSATECLECQNDKLEYNRPTPV